MSLVFLLFISGAHALSIEKKGEDAVFKLTESDCRKLIIEHKPEPGVEYVPNVDVNGKPLTPVDVYGGYNKIDPEFIHIPLGAALDGYTDLARPINRLREGYVGQIDLNLKSGEIYYNGKPLQNDLVYSLRKSCRENFPNI